MRKVIKAIIVIATFIGAFMWLDWGANELPQHIGYLGYFFAWCPYIVVFALWMNDDEVVQFLWKFYNKYVEKL